MADPWAALSTKAAPNDAASQHTDAPTWTQAPNMPGSGSNSNPWGPASPQGTFGAPTQTFAPPASTSPWESPQSTLLNLNAVPQATSVGYSPQTMAQLHSAATEGAAQSGLQQMSATKRMLGESGIQGPAAAGYTGNIARQTGEAEAGANRDINLGVASNNMQAANAAALENANRMFAALQANQIARQNANNTLVGMG